MTRPADPPAADATPHVHSCDYASQPDLHIRCSGKWTTPSWADAYTGVDGIYRDDEGDLYTFDDQPGADCKVSCPTCLEMIARGDGHHG